MFAKGELQRLKEKNLVRLEIMKTILKADLGVDSHFTRTPALFLKKMKPEFWQRLMF